MYVGFLAAETITQIAEVPSFAIDKKHHQIATDIAHPPVDQWQRPLSQEKANRIQQIYSDTQKHNLMANPVLLGSSISGGTGARISVSQKVLELPDGSRHPVQNVWVVEVDCSGADKPLWILDGQHRIQGMAQSTQKAQPVPFVLLHKPGVYSPPFLAEIFTQVTTGATPMEELHAEWMKYAFKLDRYQQVTYQRAMSATITVCKESTFDGVPNPFQDNVQFNPYQSSYGHFAFQFDASQWVTMFAEHAFSSPTTLSEQEIAGEVAKAIRALEQLDQKANSTSKLFSKNDPHMILAEAITCALIKHAATLPQKRTLTEWKNYLSGTDVAFDRCHWDLPFVTSKGALSSVYGKPSKTVAMDCCDIAINSPRDLNGVLLTDVLQGGASKLKVTAFHKSGAGNKSKKGKLEHSILPGGSVNSIKLKDGAATREIIVVEAETPNIYVLDVIDKSVNPSKSYREAIASRGLDVSVFSSGHKLYVKTCSYSGDTVKETEIRLDR